MSCRVILLVSCVILWLNIARLYPYKNLIAQFVGKIWRVPSYITSSSCRDSTLYWSTDWTASLACSFVQGKYSPSSNDLLGLTEMWSNSLEDINSSC